MVHNGIEYADIQLIAEAYDLLRQLTGMKAGEIAEFVYTSRQMWIARKMTSSTSGRTRTNSTSACPRSARAATGSPDRRTQGATLRQRESTTGCYAGG